MDFPAASVAVGIFLVGQFVLKLMLEPGVAVRRTLAEAQTTLDYYADWWANPMQFPGGPKTEQTEASKALRRTAGELRAAPTSVLGYRLVRVVLGLPSHKSIREAAGGFIGLSNNLFGASSQAVEHAGRYSDTIKRNFRHWR